MQIAAPQLAAQLQKGLKSLYTLHGDEPLLVQEAADTIRAVARQQGFTERTVHTVAGRAFRLGRGAGERGFHEPVRRQATHRGSHPLWQAGQRRFTGPAADCRERARQRQHAHAGDPAAPGHGHAEGCLVRRAGEFWRHHQVSTRWTARRCRPGSRSGCSSRASACPPARRASARCSSSPTGSRAICWPRTRRSRSWPAASAGRAVVRAGGSSGVECGALRRVQAG